MAQSRTTLSRLTGPLCLVLVVLATAGALHARQPSDSGLYWDFRGNRRPLPPLELFHRDADLFSKAEDQGWRVTVPADQRKVTNVGLVMKAPVKGNFELTAGYEILRADRPTGRYPAGFELFIVTETPTREAVGLSRWARTVEGEVYTCSRMTTLPDGTRRQQHQHVPAHPRSGRLRLTRTGAEVTFWADEGTGHFQNLGRQDLGTEDLALVRLTAYACPGHSPVDIRIIDLRVCADTLPLETAESASTIPRGSVLLVLLLGLAALLFLLVCAWARHRKRRRAGEAPASAALSVPCSRCGKNLKVKAEVVGKKVRCPSCGEATLVRTGAGSE